MARFRLLLTEDPGPLLAAGEEWYRERGIEDGLAEIGRDAEQLVRGGWAGKVESDRQIYVVAGLAHACGLDSEEAMIHWGDWKIGAYDEYFEALKPVLPAASVRYCEFLRRGRPLFGSGMEAEWAYYSYLVADEVRRLGADVAVAHARMPALDSAECIHGFPTEFRGWFREIEGRGADLWLFAE